MRIHGVNSAGHESGNEAICDGRTIPWLQEGADDHVWVDWDVAWRDVVILDGENRRVAVFNLTQHGLHEPANHDSLRALLLELANR